MRCHPHADAFRYLVAHTPEDPALGVGIARCVDRVLEAPVNPLVIAGEGRAVVTCPVAYGDDIVEGLTEELPQVLAAVRGQILIDFRHELAGQRVNGLGVGAGAVDLDILAAEVPQQGLGYLRAAGIARAQK